MIISLCSVILQGKGTTVFLDTVGTKSKQNILDSSITERMHAPFDINMKANNYFAEIRIPFYIYFYFIAASRGL